MAPTGQAVRRPLGAAGGLLLLPAMALSEAEARNGAPGPATRNGSEGTGVFGT